MNAKLTNALSKAAGFIFTGFLVLALPEHAGQASPPGPVSLSADPGQLIINIPHAPGHFESSPVQVSVMSTLPAWSVICLAEPFVHEETGYILPMHALQIQHMYSGGQFIPLNTSILLAEGGQTSGHEIVNRFTIKIQAPPDIPGGRYHGLIRLKSEELGETVLPVELYAAEFMGFELTEPVIHFHVNGPPGMYASDERVMLNVWGNHSDWHLHVKVDPVRHQRAHIGAGKFYVRCHDESFMESSDHLGHHRKILNGGETSLPESIPVHFGLKTTPELPPGTYYTQIHIFRLPVKGHHQEITLDAVIIVEPYAAIGLKDAKVEIIVTGEPGEYEGSPDVELNIESNTSGWKVVAEVIEDLESEDDAIPRERWLIYSGYMPELGWRPLTTPLIIAEGSRFPPNIHRTTRYKVETSIQDKAGFYIGKVRYTVVYVPN